MVKSSDAPHTWGDGIFGPIPNSLRSYACIVEEVEMVSPKAHFFVGRIVVSSLADFLLVLCEKGISHDEDEPHLWATSCLCF